MKTKTRQYAIACDGNLALALRPQRLRVIEGGLAAHTGAPSEASARMMDSRTDLNLRFACVVVAFVVLLTAVWHASDRYADAKAAHILGEAASDTIVIDEGDTLWGIADACDIKGCTTEQVVRYIRELNGLESSVLNVGTSLLVPVDGEALQ